MAIATVIVKDMLNILHKEFLGHRGFFTGPVSINNW